MKRNIYIFGSVIGFAAISAVLAGIYRFNFTNDDIYSPAGGIIDSKDGLYNIGERKIILKNGYYEEAAAPGSVSKNIYRYFGNDVTADFNNDGKQDSAFLLTGQTGGSGTFYYVAAKISYGEKFIGTNAVFIGDRVAPQTTEYRNGEIIVNYADRRPGEPFSAPPSVGISKYFKITGNQLKEIIK